MTATVKKQTSRKTSSKKPKLKLVYVVWEDAGPIIPDDVTWVTRDEILKYANDGGHDVHSVGWLISRTKKHIIIALSCLPEYRGIEDIYSSVDKIPVGWIKSIKYLKF